MSTVIRSEFGPHLMLDCTGCNPEKIGDLQLIWDFLNQLPAKIGMTKITQPYVFPYEGLIPEDRGVTGMVIIAESHLTFHSFVDKDYFFFDLFSCKNFDVEAALQHVIDTFEVKSYEMHRADRGRYFPRSLEERAHLLHPAQGKPLAADVTTETATEQVAEPVAVG